MSDPSQAVVTLEQRKLFTTLFVAQEKVLTSAPLKLATCFVMEPAGGGDLERLVRITTLADIDDVGIPVNQLSYFTAAAHSFSGVVIGDVLRIFPYPEKWGPQDGTVLGVPYKAFNIVGISGSRLQLDDSFWTMLTPGAVGFDVTHSGTPIDSGANGATERFVPGLPLWKCDRYLSSYSNSQDALDHMTFTQTFVDALAIEASLDGPGYLAFPPGNPVTNTYTG